MKILVITPGDPVGQSVVRELLAPEFSVRVIADDSNKLPDDIRSAVEIVPGGFETATAWKHALDGVESILWCHSSVGAEPTRLLPQQLVRAIQEIPGGPLLRVVTVSAIGNENWEAAFDGALVRHIRCGVLMENFRWQIQPMVEHGVVAGPTSPDTLIPFVAATDVADAALRRLVKSSWRSRSAESIACSITLSHARIAEVLEEVLSRSVQFRQLSPAAFVQWLRRCGVNPQSAHHIAAAFAAERSRANATVSHVASRMAFHAWAGREFGALATALPTHSCVSDGCCCSI